MGASTCASGSQVWNGNIGILIAKPMNSATHTTLVKSMPISVSAFLSQSLAYASFMMSKVCAAGVPSTSAVGFEL